MATAQHPMAERRSRAGGTVLRALGAALLICLVVLGVGGRQAMAAFEGPVAVDIRGAGDDRAARLILSFDRPVETSHQLLDHPWRLVLDFERIGYGFDPEAVKTSGMIRALRCGDLSDTGSRMIFDISTPFVVREMSVSSQDGLYQLVIDIAASGEAAFRRAMLDSLQTSSVVRRDAKRDRLGADTVAGAADGRFVVVLDPGHGGIDSGAVGAGGTREKDVTLAFAGELREALGAIPGITVAMTRETDTFISLDERVRFGRQVNASLFVSLHADSVRQDYVRGATVYTSSEKASDSVAAEIAESENLSDAIAGITYDEAEPGVADILVDLARQETLGFSVQFARLAVAHIAKSARMIRNPHRYAGFRVLKAPDVPSVLVEMGYLSNAQDEKLLNDAAWRKKLAAELAAAIAEFAALSGRNIALGNGG